MRGVKLAKPASVVSLSGGAGQGEQRCWGVKGWGEGLPVEASPRGAITPSRPHPAPIPTKKRPAATEEFFRKNS